MHRRLLIGGLHKARARSIAAAFGACALLSSGDAPAAEFCVSCETPSAHYSCVLPGPAADDSDTRLKLWCMTELAKAGGHASCSVDRQQKTPCNGTVKTIALPPGYELGPAPAAPETTAGGQQPPQPATAPVAKPSGGPISGEIVIPKSPAPPSASPAQDAATKTPPGDGEGKSAAETATDAATGAAEAAGSALDKAGKAVGTAAQKTWTCITSLFGDC